MPRKKVITGIIRGFVIFIAFCVSVWLLFALNAILYPFYADVSNVTVHGRVTDESGRPQEGVKIELRNHYYTGGNYNEYSKSERQTTYTDPSGEYLFKVALSDWIHVDTTYDAPSPLFQARHTSHFKKTMRFDFVLNEPDFMIKEKYVTFSKKINAGYDFKFCSDTDSTTNEYRWISLLIDKSNNIDTLEAFRYDFDNIPIKKTPDVWEETIYKLFSVLDILLLSEDELIVLYDKFGEIEMKIYKIGDNEKKSAIIVPIKKYNMSFLHGYDISYGKIIRIDEDLFIYYSAAAPPREELIKMSLKSNKLCSIKFHEEKKVIPEDISAAFQQFFNVKNIDELMMTVNADDPRLTVSGDKENMDYSGYIRDVEASNTDMQLGTVYMFLKTGNKTAIFRYDIDNNQLIISDYEEQDIE